MQDSSRLFRTPMSTAPAGFCSFLYELPTEDNTQRGDDQQGQAKQQAKSSTTKVQWRYRSLHRRTLRGYLG